MFQLTTKMSESDQVRCRGAFSDSSSSLLIGSERNNSKQKM